MGCKDVRCFIIFYENGCFLLFFKDKFKQHISLNKKKNKNKQHTCRIYERAIFSFFVWEQGR